MRNHPPKIKRNDNEVELNKRRKYINSKRVDFKNAIPLKELFNFLILKRAFGPNCSNVPAVSGVMYIHSDPVDQGKKDSRETKSGGSARDSYGTVRIESLKRGNTSCTEGEREWLHWAFINAMDSSWGDAVSKDKLAELSLEAIFQLGFAKDLPWPDGLECAIALKAMAAEFSSSFTVEPRDWPTKLGSNAMSKRDNLVHDQPLPALPIGYEYFLDILNIDNPGNSSLFVFEASDRQLKLEGGNELKELFVSRFIDPRDKNIELTDVHPITKAQVPFEIQKYTGTFTYYALIFPRHWDFEKTFEVSLEETEWNAETSQRFLRKLHFKFRQNPHELQLASYAYEVG